MIHANSLEANAKLDKAQARIKVLQAIRSMDESGQICTRQTVSDHLGWAINRVTGRVTELIRSGRVTEAGKVYVIGRPRAILKVTEGGDK